MKFNAHSNLEGTHAFLSASKHHWINYDDQKFFTVYEHHRTLLRGTELHKLAHDLIRLGVKLPKNNKTLNAYVNDAIGYSMQTEQVLFYSFNCYGTTDAISFKDGLLRIHDLKTGEHTASFNQLLIYSALFCLEYDYKPDEIKTELRIYQNDDVNILIPEPEDVGFIMERIKHFDQLIEVMKAGD